MSSICLPPLSCVPFFPHDRIAVSLRIAIALSDVDCRERLFLPFWATCGSMTLLGGWGCTFFVLVSLPTCYHRLMLLLLKPDFTYTLHNSRWICQPWEEDLITPFQPHERLKHDILSSMAIISILIPCLAGKGFTSVNFALEIDDQASPS
jgi:hypothetical protein